MAGNGLIEGLADRKSAKMEGLAPSELVDVGGEVVVAVVGGISVSSAEPLYWGPGEEGRLQNVVY